MNLLKNWALLLGMLAISLPISAKEINVGYQTGIEPAKLAIAEGDYEKNTGAKINWRRFDNGAELIRAIASGDIDIGNVGSSIVSTAASRHLPIKVFLVAAQLGTSEALVVRNGSSINAPQDLAGKVIAVPFVSTSHYSLLSALKHWNLDPNKTKIINLRVSEIAAAWQRGDIDAAYVWEPGLGKIKETGKVLATSTDVAHWGAPTYDLWVVNDEFADGNADFVAKFVKTSLAKIDVFRADPAGFSANAANLEKISQVTGAKTQDVKTLLSGDIYPLTTEQAKLLLGPVKHAIADTAAFLKSQGKLDAVLPRYDDSVTSRFIPGSGS